MPYFAMKSWIEMKIWGVGMLILACWGCSHSSHRVEELFYEEVNIPVDAPYLTQYIIQANLWQKGDSLFLAGFNYFTYSIDIINITEKKAVKYIPLEKQGPDPVSYVKALCPEFLRGMVLIVQFHSQPDGLLKQFIGVSRPFCVLRYILPESPDHILCRHMFASLNG